MAIVELVIPKLGESIMEATILRWHKKVGDTVKEDETVLDIATDKVDSEVPSIYGGTITEVLFKENDVVPVGAVIARIDTGGDAAQGTDLSAEEEVVVETAASPKENIVVEEPVAPTLEKEPEEEIPYVPQASATKNKPGNNKFFSPLVLNIANSEGLPLSELERIPGTGNDGRVSKKDVLQYLADKKEGKTPVLTEPQIEAIEITPFVAALSQETGPIVVTEAPKPSTEIIEMDRMRKLIAKHMVDSQNTSAHVTSFAEADVTNMVQWRDKIKADFEKREGTKITFTPMFIECLVKVMKCFPLINSSVEGDKIIVKNYFNIGMATALPSGNLIVPVIKNAEQMHLVGLTRAVNDLAVRARGNKLKPDDTQGGTFTLTNVGSFGSLMGTPIINQPQVAIMAVGIIKKRPMVIETDKGDFIGVRHMMYLSLSYDHRIIDGSMGAGFLSEVAKEFENWDVSRELKLVVKEHYTD